VGGQGQGGTSSTGGGDPFGLSVVGYLKEESGMGVSDGNLHYRHGQRKRDFKRKLERSGGKKNHPSQSYIKDLKLMIRQSRIMKSEGMGGFLGR